MTALELGAILVLVASAAGCSHQVALRPGKTCDGGNVEQCRSACDQNQGQACYRLGWFHEQGVGVKESTKKAIELYDRACRANYAVACRALGIVYWRGDDVKRNRKRAIAYYQQACKLGLAEACPTEQMLAEAEGKKRRGGASGSVGVSVSVDAEASGSAGEK